MEKAEVCYYRVRDSVVIEFSLKVHTSELGELEAYSNFVMKSVKEDFKSLIDDYGFDFCTNSGYVIRKGNDTYVVVSMSASPKEGLEEHLLSRGIPKGSNE